MYETRGAVRGLAKSPEQKKIAKDFFQSIEESSLQATLKNQEKCAAACANSSKLLDDFVAALQASLSAKFCHLACDHRLGGVLSTGCGGDPAADDTMHKC